MKTLNSRLIGHMQDKDGFTGIIVVSVKYGEITYKGRKYWNCEEMLEDKEC